MREPISIVECMDCLEYMKTVPDHFFDLAIVDPPYGIGANWKKDRKSQFYKHQSSYVNNEIPTEEYFQELFRISVNQIIWGANYYTEFLPSRQSWIVWDKNKRYLDSHQAEGELAWNSFNIPLRIVKNTWNGCVISEPRSGIHPHEKPIGLYRWVLREYADPGNKIFDSHLGSGSSRIAAYEFGFDFWGCEIDSDYWNAQERRFDNFKLQPRLF